MAMAKEYRVMILASALSLKDMNTHTKREDSVREPDKET